MKHLYNGKKHGQDITGSASGAGPCQDCPGHKNDIQREYPPRKEGQKRHDRKLRNTADDDILRTAKHDQEMFTSVSRRACISVIINCNVCDNKKRLYWNIL